MRQNILIGLIIIGCFYFLFGFSSFQIQENSPPEIKIITPLSNITYSSNSILPYEIHVLDYEDGNSEYDEINPTEVLLVVKYVKDSTGLKSYLKSESNTDYNTLYKMGKSTCFNCHRAKGILIGPSFDRIAAKYNKDTTAVESLAKKIITGSSSIWGDEKMPPHPDLGLDQVREMVRWILENNSDPNKDYLAGIRGTIKTKEQDITSTGKKFLVMMASYRDHGSNDHQKDSKQAQNILILESQ